MQRALPPDYASQIDARFVQILKDPGSRRVTYGTPRGGAICGTANARNSFGGYTGAQVFLAYFNKQGQLEALKIYLEKELALKRFALDMDAQLLKACGAFGNGE
jgi:hypothetical protein